METIYFWWDKCCAQVVKVEKLARFPSFLCKKRRKQFGPQLIFSVWWNRIFSQLMWNSGELVPNIWKETTHILTTWVKMAKICSVFQYLSQENYQNLSDRNQNYRPLRDKFSTGLSELHFICLEEHFGRRETKRNWDFIVFFRLSCEKFSDIE